MFFACEASHNARLSAANPTSLEAGHFEWAKPATLVVDECSTNSAIANATIVATNPTFLEAGHREWAMPATFVDEAGHTCGR